MSLMIKICGITEAQGLQAAVEGGADFIGFIFCEKGLSKCYMEPADAAALLAACPRPVTKPFPQIVGVLRDQSDVEILEVVNHVPVDYLQLHGQETPERVAEIRKLTGKRVIKVFRIAAQEHFDMVALYEDVADMFLFDTLTPGPTAGGTGKSFNWALLQGLAFKRDWVLAGGLNADNLTDALATSGAHIVDVSSGVEKPGLEHGKRVKDPAKVSAFLHLAQSL